MSEVESREKILIIPLSMIRPAPFNMTVISPHEEELLREEMRVESKGIDQIDPILVRRLTPEEIEKTRDRYPNARYEVVDGHTRFRIAQELGWSAIKARVIDATYDQALEIAYRKNKERGAIDPLKEAQYIKYLVQDRKIPPYEVAQMFQMKVEEVKRLLAKAIPNREARRIISEYEMYEYGRPIPGKVLEAIASAPLEKQPAIAQAVVMGKLKPSEVEAAKSAIIQGLTVEEAVKIAKQSKQKKADVSSEETFVLPQPVSMASTEPSYTEITCPKCGAKAKVYWETKQILWE